MASRKKKVNVILVFAILVLKKNWFGWWNRQLIVQNSVSTWLDLDVGITTKDSKNSLLSFEKQENSS